MTDEYDTHAEAIAQAVESAGDTLYATLSEMLPEITTGDVSPGETMALQGALESAARSWIDNNYPRPPSLPRFAVGLTVRLTSAVARDPFFLARPGLGTVSESSEDILAITMHEHIPGCEESGNAVLFTVGDLDTDGQFGEKGELPIEPWMAKTFGS